MGGENFYSFAPNTAKWIDISGAMAQAAAGCVIGSPFGGPIGCAAGATIATIATAVVAVVATVYTGTKIAEAAKENSKTNTCEDKKKRQPCPPCKTQSGKTVVVGTIGYRHDLVPPSKPHHPFTGDHYNLYKANQNPNNCKCFWKPFGAADASGGKPPPAGSIKIEPFV